ncbi:MAG: hypothetical protein PHG61_07120 [Candidatus Marinimicrobia bacterium]|nr:hypothetical protein [Candidatus Neomarinimicrobiota bacterium]
MLNRTNHKLLTIILVIISLTVAELKAFGDKYAGEFLKFGLGVREMALGGAVSADPTAVAAHYWNPASLVGNSHFSGSLMHTEEFAGAIALDHFALALPGKGEYSYGAGYFRIGVDDIVDTHDALLDLGTDGLGPGDEGYPGPDADGTEGNGKLDPGERLDYGKFGSFGASENAAFFSVAKQLRPKLKIGGTLKTIYRSLGDDKAYGLGFDVAVLYQLTPRINLAAVLNDATTTFMLWNDGEREIIVPSLRLGGSAHYTLKKISLQINPLVGADILFEGRQNTADLNLGGITARARLGLEVIYKETLALRAGRDDLGNPQIGLGLSAPFGSIDYGLGLGGSYAEFGSSHRIALILHFAELRQAIKTYL